MSLRSAAAQIGDTTVALSATNAAARRQADARCGAKSKRDNREKACAAQYLRVDRSDLAVELSAPVRGDADVRQHTIVELLEFANITANASLSG
jgi:hypothetical protein